MTADIIDLRRARAARNQRRGLIDDDDPRFDKAYLERAARGLLVDHERASSGKVWLCRLFDIFCDKPGCATECKPRAALRATGRLFERGAAKPWRRRRGPS